jgi:hypothetical protein
MIRPIKSCQKGEGKALSLTAAHFPYLYAAQVSAHICNFGYFIQCRWEHFEAVIVDINYNCGLRPEAKIG